MIVTLSLVSFTAVSATPRAVNCGADSICGGYQGGAGVYLPPPYTGPHSPGGFNGSVNDRSSYAAVRYDGFAPDPAFIKCEVVTSSLKGVLNLPPKLDGPFYIHYRVAISRFTTGAPLNLVADQSVVGGIQPNVLQTGGPNGTAIDFNADTGATRPSQHSSQGPTHSNPWISPDYRDAPVCLPLLGGGNAQAILKAAKPDLTFKPGVKGLVGMKKATVNVEIEERTLIENGIDLHFELDDIVILVCDDDKRVEGTFEGCISGTHKKSPVYFNTKNIKFKQNGSKKSADVKIKFRKKGKFSITIGAAYTGRVDVNGSPTSSTNITAFSAVSQLTVRSSTSVNRK